MLLGTTGIATRNKKLLVASLLLVVRPGATEQLPRALELCEMRVANEFNTPRWKHVKSFANPGKMRVDGALLETFNMEQKLQHSGEEVEMSVGAAG